MSVPFPDIEPYKALGVSEDAAPAQIKKAYRKLCLKYHPDKLVGKSEQEQETSKVKFQEISFAYAILSDVKRRKRYDDTGSVADFCAGEDGDFNWKDFFNNMKENQITEELIEQDKKIYQNSKEELDDIVDAFQYYEGHFLKLFESIPHLEFTRDEEVRIFDIIQDQISEGAVPSDYKHWKLYVKNRDKNVKKQLKRADKEAKEAEELKQKLNLKNKKLDTEGDLKLLIQKKNSNKFDDMISNLEKKYGSSKVTKGKARGLKGSRKTKKRSTHEELDEMDDEAFEAAQAKLLKRSNT